MMSTSLNVKYFRVSRKRERPSFLAEILNSRSKASCSGAVANGEVMTNSWSR